jgi:hypothetical protein
VSVLRLLTLCGSAAISFAMIRTAAVPFEEKLSQGRAEEDAMALPAAPLIALVPTRGVVAAELVQALINNAEGHRIILRMVNRETVDVARNRLAAEAVAAADDPELFGPGTDPYVFWIDSDAFFVRGTLTLLMHTLEQHPSIDVLAALFGPRGSKRGAAAFRKLSDPESLLFPGTNCERGEVVDVEQVGFHFTLHRVSLLRALGPNPFGEPSENTSDDAAFCRRIQAGRGRIAVATGIPVFHLDERTGAAYTPGLNAVGIDGDTIDETRVPDELPFELRAYGDRIDSILRDPTRHVRF